jgi:hypothetical protein
MNKHAENVGNRGRLTALLLAAALLPAIVAYTLLYNEAFHVPYQDDYHTILDFAINYVQLPTLKAKVLDVATNQTNDYKLVFLHFITAMEIELTGHLSFRFLTTFGNLLLLPIAYLLWQTYRTDTDDLNHRLIEFIPISFIFFSLTYWETLNWAMAELQNISVIVFSFLAIYLLIPKPTASHPRLLLLLSCLSAILAAFSSANGFLLAPVGLLFLVRRRALLASLAWCASFAVPIAAYLYHYTPYAISVNTLHAFSTASKIFYLFAFLGCVIPSPELAALLGVLIAAVILWAAYSGFEQTNPVAFYFTVWILATAFLPAWLRGEIPSRYSIYSILLLVFCYSFLAQHLRLRSIALDQRQQLERGGRRGARKRGGRQRDSGEGQRAKRLYATFLATSIVVAVAFCLLSDLSAYKLLSRRREMVLLGIKYYCDNPEANPPTVDRALWMYAPAEPAFERVTLTEVIQQHIYTLPSTP